MALSGDAEACATRVNLTYVNDTEPGIRRRRAGTGFTYILPDGARVTDPWTLKRIKSLAVPPAWTDVWISADPSGHIQATGRDQAGRKQYRYHPDWATLRDEEKFSSLPDFAEALPALRARVDGDLRKRGVKRERVVASVVWLLDHTMMRIGNDSYMRDNKSYGATTLRSRHVRINGSELRFAFVGKSGQEWKLRLVDRRIANALRAIQEIPGQHLFQYIDTDGTRRPIHSQDVNDYIRDAIGEQFTSKDFRTWGGTTAAALLLAETATPASQRQIKRTLNQVIDTVATRLRNTRAVCRRGYIHPDIISAWEAGRLCDQIAEIQGRLREPRDGLDTGETAVLTWLRDYCAQ